MPRIMVDSCKDMERESPQVPRIIVPLYAIRSNQGMGQEIGDPRAATG